jgi:murein DD-endopeptidase MepM/ murein hydrolase activator NlpD
VKPLCVLLLAGILLPSAAAAEDPPQPRDGASHAVPLFGELVRIYDAPPDPFAAGHRGVDVAAPTGTPVRASADGVVTFVGTVVDNLTVTVAHGGELLTSYSFLGTALVRRGDPISRGTVVGTVGRGHPGSSLPPHVHLSARRQGFYVDPLELYVGSGYADLLSLTG